MAKITLDNLAHSYLPSPKGEDDFALKELNHDWPMVRHMPSWGPLVVVSPRF